MDYFDKMAEMFRENLKQYIFINFTEIIIMLIKQNQLKK